MSRAWFHRRDPHKGEGIGYGINSWQGAVATGAFVIVLVGVTTALARMADGWRFAPVLAGGFFITALISFLFFIRAHSDGDDGPLWPPQ